MSNPSIPPADRPQRLRPWSLVLALALAWFLGAAGASSGCSSVASLRDGRVVDVEEVRQRALEAPQALQGLLEVGNAAHMQATAEQRHVTFPLSTARMLLGCLVVVASGLAMTGRKGSRELALQALLAYAGFVVLQYALTHAVRSHWIAIVVATALELPSSSLEYEPMRTPQFWWWMARMQGLVFDIGFTLLAVWALSTDRARRFFQAAERSAERAEDA